MDLRAALPPGPRPVVRAARTSGHLAARPPHATPREGATSNTPRRRSRFALVALVVVQALFLAAIAWGLTSSSFAARYVQVQGASDATMLAAIQRLPLRGCNIFRCDLTQRTRLVEALPTVASAQVHTIYPDGLLVVVTPRQPTLLWQTDAASLVLASDGTVLGPLASDPAYAKLPLLPISDPTGAAFAGHVPAPGARIPATQAEMAGQLRTGITRTLGAGWTLQWTANSGFVAIGGSGAQVLFGTPDDAAQALTSYPNPATLVSAPTAADVDRGVAAQLGTLHGLRKQLAGSGQQAVLIDLRWGPHPYFRLAGGA